MCFFDRLEGGINQKLILSFYFIDSPEKENKFIKGPNLKELEKRQEEIGNVKNELECLRRMVAEKHAEEIGKNMCITQ